MKKQKILIICGPTATGKTAAAVSLAGKFSGEIVSADSRQVYREMDIGTGKDLNNKFTAPFQDKHGSFSGQVRFTEKYRNREYNLFAHNMGGVPLWMVDVVDPDQEFSVSHYAYLTDKVIRGIVKRGNNPIIAGGTGLYIKSLINPVETAAVLPDRELRKKLNTLTIGELKKYLLRIDKTAYDNLNNSDRNNPRRLIRKIEISRSGKIKPGKKKNINCSGYEFLSIGLKTSNKLLFSKIDRRVDLRMEEGLLDEIQNLLNKGYEWEMQSMNALGYREWKIWFENAENHNNKLKKEIIQKWRFDEHAYARRQLTWFKKQPGIKWFDISDKNYSDQIIDYVSTWYNE